MIWPISSIGSLMGEREAWHPLSQCGGNSEGILGHTAIVKVLCSEMEVRWREGLDSAPLPAAPHRRRASSMHTKAARSHVGTMWWGANDSV
jgi:hypothetical protein